MFWNPFTIPAIIGGVLLYFVGAWLSKSVRGRKAKWGVVILLVLLCLPALSFDLYYAHLAVTPWWYSEFRSVTGIETLAACWGLLFGFFSARLLNTQSPVNNLVRGGVVFAAMLLLISLPFLKPLLRPVETNTPLREMWQGKVCLQSSGATCGPAVLASIFAYYNQHHSEREIARGAYSSATGTELWYLLRFARKHGLREHFMPVQKLSDIPVPALLGVTASAALPFTRSGHFVSLLGKDSDGYLIGDPLVGGKVLKEQEFTQMYGRICDVVHFSN